jgi:hypothetical protein
MYRMGTGEAGNSFHGIVATSNKIARTNDGMLFVYNLCFIAKSYGQTPSKFPGVE